MEERGKRQSTGAAAISKCLSGAHFPISKEDLISQYGFCEIEFKKGETMNLEEILEDVPDKTFNSVVDLEQEINKM